jgi:hypothetical protein
MPKDDSLLGTTGVGGGQARLKGLAEWCRGEGDVSSSRGSRSHEWTLSSRVDGSSSSRHWGGTWRLRSGRDDRATPTVPSYDREM